VVTDKGYHSGPSLVAMREMGVRSYVSVPQQPRRHWKNKAEEQTAVYANRRRVEGERGKQLLRRRGEFLERPFAHQYETGGLRRVHVRGLGNVAKRVLLQATAFNLALLLRSLTKAGTPRGLADMNIALFCALWRLLAASHGFLQSPFPRWVNDQRFRDEIFTAFAKSQSHASILSSCRKRGSDTGC